MRQRAIHISIFISLSLMVLMGCNKDKDQPAGCGEHCINLSQLQTKTHHYLPFTLYNDIADNRVDQITMNGKQLSWPSGESYEFNESGFFELVLDYHTGARDTILFSLVLEERDHAEWGLGTWVPEMFETTMHQGEAIELLHPGIFTEGMEVPFIFYVKENNKRTPVYFDATHNASGNTFNIKRGVGSVQLNAADIQNAPLAFSIGGTTVNSGSLSSKEVDMTLEGNINSHQTIPANSIVHITGDLRLSEGSSLTLEEGVVMLVDEGINIENNSQINAYGTVDNPILITCSSKDKYWGGFMTDGSGTSLEAKYTIFSRSGYHDTEDYNWGHAGRQALFYNNHSTLTLDHCYMLDHIGQVFYPSNSTLDLNHILVQRVQTGGQLNYTTATIRHAVFTDFPDDSQSYKDADNDGLYIHASDVNIDSSVFMFAKDDGLDSGGGEGGEVTISNTRFEACFHEGAALSSGGTVDKTHTFNNCVFINCGQGLELGFSSSNHKVFADDCLFQDNYIGIRYGDNYEWSNVNGEVTVTHSKSIDNVKDIWNMVRGQWAPKLDNMHFENVQVSKKSTQYPELEVIE